MPDWLSGFKSGNVREVVMPEDSVMKPVAASNQLTGEGNVTIVPPPFRHHYVQIAKVTFSSSKWPFPPRYIAIHLDWLMRCKGNRTVKDSWPTCITSALSPNANAELVQISLRYLMLFHPTVEEGECPAGTFAIDNGVFCCNTSHKADYSDFLNFTSPREDCPDQDGELCPQVPEASCARSNFSAIPCKFSN